MAWIVPTLAIWSIFQLVPISFWHATILMVFWALSNLLALLRCSRFTLLFSLSQLYNQSFLQKALVSSTGEPQSGCLAYSLPGLSQSSLYWNVSPWVRVRSSHKWTIAPLGRPPSVMFQESMTHNNTLKRGIVLLALSKHPLKWLFIWKKGGLFPKSLGSTSSSNIGIFSSWKDYVEGTYWLTK